MDGSQQKWVERLSLLFDKEDKTLFRKRVRLSKEYQLRAEDEIRFQDYAEEVPSTQISTLPDQWARQIKRKVARRKGRSTEEDIAWEKTLTEKILNTVREEYMREMKKMVVLTEMKDKKNAGKFKDLRIQLRKPVHTVQYYGTISKLHYERSFKDLFSKLVNNHTTKEPALVSALREFSERNMSYIESDILSVELSPNELPMRLSAFIGREKNDHAKNLQSLHIQWREYIGNEISENLRGIELYNSAIPQIEEYEDKKRLPMKRFIQRVDLIFRDSVRTLC